MAPCATRFAAVQGAMNRAPTTLLEYDMVYGL